MLSKLKKILCFLIGLVICRIPLFCKYKKYLLSFSQSGTFRNNLDRLFLYCVSLYWFRSEYLSERDPDKREILKKQLIGGESAKTWAKHYDSYSVDFNSKVGSLTYDEARPLLSRLNNLLSTSSEKFIVVQIGSSSGSEIAWLAQRNNLHSYIGTDIYSEVVSFSSERHNLPNLNFQLCSAKNIYKLLNKYLGRNIVIFSSVSLMYVQPEHLEVFFISISGIPKLQIILLEGASESKINPIDLKGSLWWGNLCYTHNYRFYAEKAGLITKSCEIIRPYFPYGQFPGHKDTVHYFYWAKSKES